LDLRQLEVFLGVIEHRTVTRAAEKLYVSPGAISLQLQNLAAELKTPLFVRSGKNIVPTPAAERLAVHVREVLRRVREIRQDFGSSAEQDRHPFHFASGATTLIYRLGNPLRAIRKRFPDADLHITVAPTEKIVSGLLDHHFDLGLISLPLENPALTILPLFEEELLLIRPLHRASAPEALETIRPEELKGVPFLLFPPDSNMRDLIDRFFADIGVQPRVTMEADDTEVIKRMVEAGFGYSILPQFALGGRDNRFQRLRVAGRRLARQQALATARSPYPRALTTEIAGLLQAALTRKTTVHAR
jgi:DNA-binding transcriptional LysR family regulator